MDTVKGFSAFVVLLLPFIVFCAGVDYLRAGAPSGSSVIAGVFLGLIVWGTLGLARERAARAGGPAEQNT